MRLGPKQNGEYPLLFKKIYRIATDSGSVISQIIEPIYKKTNLHFEESVATQNVIKNNQLSWKATIDEALDFVLEQYRERRKQWSSAFRDKLRQIAEKYKFNSTYITIMHQADSTNLRLEKVNTILGTLRLIEESNGKLPMEDYLGISINSAGKKKFEPGNFAIDKSVNEYAFGEILIHLIKTILEKSKNQESHYYTYADRQSLFIYRLLGFKPLERESYQLSEYVDVDSQGRIRKDDIDWTLIEASRLDLENLLTRYLSGGIPNRDNSNIHTLMKSRNDQLVNNSTFQDRIFRGQVTLGDTKNSPSGESRDTTEPCALYMRPEEDHWRILFGRTNKDSLIFRGWESFTIPNGELKNGFYKEQNRIGVKEVITYNNGILTYKQFNESSDTLYVVYQIKISPDLESVEFLKADYNPGTSFHTEYTAYF